MPDHAVTEEPEKGPPCRFCGATLRHVFVDLGMSPLCESYVDASALDHMEAFYPLRVLVCESCFLVQLQEYVAAEDIFSDYAYFSSYSDHWLAHCRSYVEMITERLGLGPGSQVVELASNDGYLLQYFVERGIPALGIEPAANVAEVARARGIPTEVLFFGRETARELAGRGLSADLVLGNNVLAHVPDLNGFVAGMKTILGPRGVVTMEFPHLVRLVEQNQFDTIYHEHFSYFSLTTVEQVFAAHGLALFDVEQLPTHGGSLRVYCRHAEDTSKPVGERVERLRHEEEAAGLRDLAYYSAFGDQVQRTKWNLLEFLIEARRAGRSVAGYGAPGKGNTLLNYCGIRTDFLDYTVDRNPLKQGRFLPGTHVPIHAPEQVFRTRPDHLLILPWNLKDEIMEQMGGIREWGGSFVIPIPELEVHA